MSDEKVPLKKEQLAKISKYLVFAGVGVALLVMAGIFSPKGEEVQEGKTAPEAAEIQTVPTLGDQITHDETALEKRVADILSKVHGVGKVQVRVYLASTTERQFAVNASTNHRTTSEKDPEGAARTISETTEDGQLVMERGAKSGAEDPVLIKAVKPEIEGILVVAEGAQDYRTKLALTRTIETLLNIPAHKISVQPMEK
ncbi:MAG: hypothetical protein M0021_16470 [Clostridia bacterium]|nr:hypothetical protein [Clostridia bacterium]